MRTWTSNQLELNTNALRQMPALRRRPEVTARDAPNEEAAPGRARQRGVPGAALTGREQEIMRLLARGQSVADIAGDLGMSTKTVRNHLSNIFPKLGARRQAEAILVWLGHSVGL